MTKALFLNCSLKSSDELSNTEALINEVIAYYQDFDIESEIVRVVDYNVAYGVTTDEGDGDEWPVIFEKVQAADIVVIGTPLWLGEKSSIATQVVERFVWRERLNERSRTIHLLQQSRGSHRHGERGRGKTRIGVHPLRIVAHRLYDSAERRYVLGR